MDKNFKNKIDQSFFKGIAHRGLHNEKYTENGLNAFKHAIDNNLAFELDVHLTKDNELIVCHDSSLKRTTGKEGIIEELTLEEIKANYKLLDGEDVPTLKEVLNLNNERSLIVIELKPLKNYKALSKKVLEETKDIKDNSKITFISFDPRSLYFLKTKRFTKGLLLSETRQDVLFFRNFFDYLDIDYKLLNHSKLIKYRKKGGTINIWTIDTIKKYQEVKDKVDAITFEHIDIKNL